MRVVSLLPSATRASCAIPGGEALLVGRSHECDFPARIADRPVLTAQRTLGGTSAEIDAQVKDALGQSGASSLYHLDEALLHELKPDVILTQDLCAVCSIDLNAVRRVAGQLSPVPIIVSLNPACIEDVFDDLLKVGTAVGLERSSQSAMVDLRGDYWSAIDYVNPYLPGPEVAFLEWMDPLFAGGHWTPQLIVAAGGRHSLNEAGAKSRQVTAEELVETLPDRLIICPCGFDLACVRRELPALSAQRWWNSLPAVQGGRVALVDGNQMFNRPGPRLVQAFRWLVALINDRPELSPTDFPVENLPLR